MAIAIVVLVFSALVLGNMTPRLTILGKPSERTPLVPFTRCNDAGDEGDLMWDGSRIVGRSGIHYVTVEITMLVYGGGVPSIIGLKSPISAGGVTFSSPSPESFTMTITLGVLYITITFADGTQRNHFPRALQGQHASRLCFAGDTWRATGWICCRVHAEHRASR